MFKTLHEGLDKLEAGVKKVADKTIGELGSDIVEGVKDVGTAAKKKVEELGAEIKKGL